MKSWGTKHCSKLYSRFSISMWTLNQINLNQLVLFITELHILSIIGFKSKNNLMIKKSQGKKFPGFYDFLELDYSSLESK